MKITIEKSELLALFGYVFDIARQTQDTKEEALREIEEQLE